MDYINLTKFLFVLGVDLIPFFIYIGKSTKPKKGFYYLSFSVSILLITPLILQGEQPLSIDFLYYPIITINSSILSLELTLIPFKKIDSIIFMIFLWFC